MAKRLNIDSLMNELGIDQDGSKPAHHPTKPGSHRVDKAEQSFSPLPAVSSGQVPSGFGADSAAVDELMRDDPAVPVQPAATQHSSVGDSLSDLWAPSSEDETQQIDLARLLVERDVITEERLATAEKVIKQSPGRKLEDVLLELGADETALLQVVAEVNRLDFERIDLSGDGPQYDGTLLQRLGVEFAKDNLLMPLRREGSRAVIGTTKPDDIFLLDEVRRKLGGIPIKHVLVPAYDIRGVLEMFAEEETSDVDVVDEILGDIEEDDVEVVQESAQEVDLEQQAGESPVIRYVNYIIQTAFKDGASDIHIEPGEKKLRVRLRIDGVLYETMNPPHSMSAAITSRLKIMANLDIAERRLPQDGRIRCVVQGRKLDLRVSTLPTAHGEKLVLRILDTKSISVGLDELGFDDNTLQIWKSSVAQPHGIILVTGPTGSGKTTTLYASLRQMDLQRLNVSTVEDPIEYQVSGITQTQTHERIGVTFAIALRALLRQDPDVIMLGEIRDLETATIAIQASLTGHLVLSTLHTNDAPSSVTRLINIGIEPFLIGAAVNVVLAQRLVRRVCAKCKSIDAPPADLAEFLVMNGLPSDKIVTANGCERCRQTGYAGRAGLYELLVLDDQIRDVITRSPNVTEFRRLCLERGMVSLRQDGLTKVGQGITTVEEVMRVTEATI
ncbi:MAG: Flp pilus assembly complex ATPase component TadA [Phycisphaerales bacterium]|nr:Flp pilus assembly complex ATPase component TadA [Phycisphaerales bacterium]